MRLFVAALVPRADVVRMNLVPRGDLLKRPITP